MIFDKISRRKILKYGTTGAAGLVTAGTASASGDVKQDGVTINNTSIISENSKCKFRKTTIDGVVHISRINKKTGAVGVVTAGKAEDVRISTNDEGISVQDISVASGEQVTKYVEVIEESTGYEITINDQCHLTKCDKTEFPYTNKEGSAYDHRIIGTAIRLTDAAATITNAVLTAALLDALAYRLPAAVVSLIKKKKSLSYIAQSAGALMGGELGGKVYSTATYDYDLGSFGVYTPRVGVGVSNTWKGDKSSLVPLPELGGFLINDYHIGSKCNGN